MQERRKISTYVFQKLNFFLISLYNGLTEMEIFKIYKKKDYKNIMNLHTVTNSVLRLYMY